MSLRPIARLVAILALAASLPAGAAGVVLRDDFSDAGSGWPNHAATHASDLGFAVYTDDGQYQMTPVRDNAFGVIAAPRQAAGGNVRIESDLFLYAGVGAGAGGLVCRYRDHDNFYAFLARGDAVLLILKIKDGKATALAKGSVKSVMAGSVDTRFSAECRDDTLRLSARDGSTISARDADLRGGSAGLVVIGERMAGTSAVFDNVLLADLGGGQAEAAAAASAGGDSAAGSASDSDGVAADDVP